MSSIMLQAGLVVGLLIVGYLFGSLAEKRHYKKIVARESSHAGLPVVASRYPPKDRHYHQHLVTGSVVISSDYFKSFVAGLLNIFGGRVTPFESLLDRGRRESVLRMKEQAKRLNGVYVFNIKFETTRVAAGRVAALEVLAYGTAMVPIEQPAEMSHADMMYPGSAANAV